MKIKSIYIDGLHNVHDKTYTFSDITYLHGRNGAGKSTVLNAIQYALLGYIPGTSKTKAAVLRHSKDNSIVVKLVLDDNGNEIKISRILTENISSVTIEPEGYDITNIINDLELPIFNFNEFVGQTANKLKDYFIQHILPINNGTIMWTEVLTNAIRDINISNHEEILGRGVSMVSDISGDPLSQAVQANQMFKDEQSAISAELKSLQGAIDSLIFYDDYTGPTDINQIEDQIRELSLLKDSVIAYRTAEIQAESVYNKLLTATKELNELKSIGDIELFEQGAKNASETCEDLSIKIVETEDKVREINAEIHSMQFIINSRGICQYTGTVCNSISAKIDEFIHKVDDLQKKRDQLQDIINTDRANYTLKNIEFENARNNITRWNSLTSQIDSLKFMVSSMPTKPTTDKTDIELAQDIKILQDNKMKAFANKKYNETIDDLTKKKFELELELAVYKAWVKATDVNGLQTEIMQQPFNILADKMTGYIQTMYGRDDIKAHFYVSSKANSFSFGMIREGKYIPYDLLSSGEKCLYTLALMICIIDNSKSPLKVVLLDDALDNLDDIAIENTFQSLYKIDGIQFIMAGVKHCENAKDVIVEIF